MRVVPRRNKERGKDPRSPDATEEIAPTLPAEGPEGSAAPPKDPPGTPADDLPARPPEGPPADRSEKRAGRSEASAGRSEKRAELPEEPAELPEEPAEEPAEPGRGLWRGRRRARSKHRSIGAAARSRSHNGVVRDTAELPAPGSAPASTDPSPSPPQKPKDPRAAERARRAAALRRTQEQRRARARRLQAEQDQRPRSAMLAMVITMGVLIAAVAVTGALIATSRQNKPVPLAAPLHIYPVTQVVPGACPGGTQGITGQTTSGQTCYQLSSGIAIRKVADLRVQSGTAAGTYDVAISLSAADRKAFADLTRASVGRTVAFVVRDQLVTAPRVDMPITRGKIVITGRFTRPDADRLVHTLRGS